MFVFVLKFFSFFSLNFFFMILDYFYVMILKIIFLKNIIVLAD